MYKKGKETVPFSYIAQKGTFSATGNQQIQTKEIPHHIHAPQTAGLTRTTHLNGKNSMFYQ